MDTFSQFCTPQKQGTRKKSQNASRALHIDVVSKRVCTILRTMIRYAIMLRQMNLINEEYVIFVVSTTGNGEFPTSARPFWRFLLRTSLPDDILSDLTFSVFGLGDSTYTRFCWAARMLCKRLKQLGAKPWFDEGEADDQHYLGYVFLSPSIDGALQPWIDSFKYHLDEDMPMPQTMKPIDDDELLPPRVRTCVTSKAPVPFVDKAETHATLTVNERITAQDHWQDVRLVELELDESTKLPTYEAGDVVCLMPENLPEKVEQLIRRLEWTDLADSQLKLFNNDPGTKKMLTQLGPCPLPSRLKTIAEA